MKDRRLEEVWDRLTKTFSHSHLWLIWKEWPVNARLSVNIPPWKAQPVVVSRSGRILARLDSGTGFWAYGSGTHLPHYDVALDDGDADPDGDYIDRQYINSLMGML